LPADAVWSDARVHPGEDLALPVREVRDREDQRDQYDDDFHEHDDQETQHFRQRLPESKRAVDHAAHCLALARCATVVSCSASERRTTASTA
jgi:hypothetical protein